LGRTIEKIIGRLRRDNSSDQSKKSNENQEKTFLKAMALNDFSDIEKIKAEIESGNILIIKITPLAKDNIEDVRRAVSELCDFINSIKGDIARLGEERIVVTPKSIRIWREKI
jgi:SepF-like predicted cell division protein (DUF552 family)